MLVFSGCANVLQLTPAPLPTNTELPPCDADQTIRNLKSKIPYSESVVLYNKMYRTSLLVLWFVDPEINPTSQESEVTKNAKLAIRDAILQSQRLNAEDGCVSRLFDEIYVIIVDKNYNGWFSGQIRIADLPATVPADEKQLDEIAKAYRTTYLREEVAANLDPLPGNSCTWVDAKQNIQNHFSSERENVDFYLIVDESGVQVWTQWDSELDLLQSNLPTSLLNITAEIDCLFPQPYIIFFQVVDKTGQTLIIGSWYWSDAKKQDMSQIDLDYLYEK